jgi:hypothetical protein
MPRYFFDLNINGSVQKDTTGRELADRGEAKKRADDVIYCLLRICDQALAMESACTVHDGQGSQVYRHALIIYAFTPETLQIVEERQARRAEARAARLEAQALKAKAKL